MLLGLAVVLIPAVLMIIAAAIVLVTTHPRHVLMAMAYAYLASTFLDLAVTKWRHRGGRVPVSDEQSPAEVTHPLDTAAR